MLRLCCDIFSYFSLESFFWRVLCVSEAIHDANTNTARYCGFFCLSLSASFFSPAPRHVRF